MQILILCDRKSSCDDVQLLTTLQGILEDLGYEYQTMVLNREAFKPCIGCFGCWLKTPGTCVITNDEANNVASMVMKADALLLLSEIAYGGFSADIKAYLDRSIQNILPFFEMYKNEMHHPRRYKRFPLWVAIGYGKVSDGEKQTFVRLAERNALNMRPDRYRALAVEDYGELGNQSEEIQRILEVSS